MNDTQIYLCEHAKTDKTITSKFWKSSVGVLLFCAFWKMYFFVSDFSVVPQNFVRSFYNLKIQNFEQTF
jgi:hypothetical protein